MVVLVPAPLTGPRALPAPGLPVAPLAWRVEAGGSGLVPIFTKQTTSQKVPPYRQADGFRRPLGNIPLNTFERTIR